MNSIKFINTSWEDGLEEIADNSIDLLLTDPPYGMSYISNHRKVKHDKKTLNTYHPTEKPVNMMRFLIEKSSKPGDLVLDTFCGSGATGLACSEINRDFIGFDLEKKYIDTCKQRLGGVTTNLFNV